MCLYSYHAYHILLQKSEKCVSERNKRLNLWILFIDWGNQFLIPTDWIIENDLHQILCVVLQFFIKQWSNGEGLGCFLRHVLPKRSKITVTCPKSAKQQKGSILTCPKLATSISTLNCSKLAKWPFWKFIYLQSWRS